MKAENQFIVNGHNYVGRYEKITEQKMESRPIHDTEGRLLGREVTVTVFLESTLPPPQLAIETNKPA